MTSLRATASFTLACVLGLGLSACRDKRDEKPARQFEKQNMLRASNDVSLPSKLWDLVAQGIGNEQSEFVPVRVRLIEKTHGVLGGHNHEITFGQGGGELDLKDYVVGPGTFWMSAELVQKPVDEAGEKLPGEKKAEDEKKAEAEKKPEGGEKKEEKKEEKKGEGGATSGPSFKVFYLSQGKERELDKLTYGAGCESYFDITSYFTKSAKKEGLLGIVAGQRYVSTLAGVYFLSLRQDDRLQIAQVTVHDSRYPALICAPHGEGEAPAAESKE